MLSVAEARERMLSVIRPIAGLEPIGLNAALGRVLARTIQSQLDVPPADNSAMDGYAVRRADVGGAGASLPLSARIQAGIAPQPLKPGTAARIFTGALIPAGADTVIMQEQCRERDGRAVFDSLPETGANIRRAGEDIARGSPVLEAGIRLAPQHLGLLASVGLAEVPVRPRIRVQVLTTGDELVAPGLPLAAGRIYRSNDAVLAGLLSQLGCEPLEPMHIPDHPDATREALARARDGADLVLTTGGVSVGEADYVTPAVETMGRLDLWKINLKPGKPVAFGDLDGVPFVGLPGNPVAVFVTFCLFAAPVIRQLQGRSPSFPEPVSLPAAFEVSTGKREEYLRARRSQGCLQRYPHQGSGVMSSIAWADGLARIPAQTVIAPHDPVEYFSFEDLMQ